MPTLSIACNHCGAPLTVAEDTRFVTCGYCKLQLEVKREGGGARWHGRGCWRPCRGARGRRSRNGFQSSATEDGDPVPPTRQKYKSCQRWNEPGDAHELTFSCFRGLRLLSSDRTRTWFVESIARARVRHAFDLWDYVIMPEHIHLLIHPRRPKYEISAVLHAIKWPVAIRSKRHVERYAPHWLPRLTDVQPNGRTAVRFWERGGGYDRNVRHDQALWSMIEYIHANPVWRGLVRDAVEWCWSSAQWYEGQRDVPLPMDDTLW